MSVDASCTSSHPIDTLFNYELHEEIGRGATSVVYRASCKRGRMRNRNVAIKKLLIPQERPSTCKDAPSPVSIHATLCHPSIVSLVSSFFAPSGFYQVHEFCGHGSLSTFLSVREPSILEEDELRGVARTLVDALVYLKKERVLHRDIKPSNILLTTDFRLKLSGFGSAVRLPTVDSTETAFCGSANYISPEILAGKPYGFTSDVWSLGCVFVTCLTGEPAFHASNSEEVFENICCARYALPDTVSYEARDLISGLLQKNPLDRTPLHRTLSHPFFKPALPVKPLSAGHMTSMLGSPITRITSDPRKPLRTYPSSLSANPLRPRPTIRKVSSKPTNPIIARRIPLEDITNYYQDDSEGGFHLFEQSPRRIVSAPILVGATAAPLSRSREDREYDFGFRPPTPALTADSVTPSVSSVATLPDSLVGRPSTLRPAQSFAGRSLLTSPRSQLKRVLSDPCAPQTRMVNADVEVRPPRLFSKATSSTAVSHGQAPGSPTFNDPGKKAQHGAPATSRGLNTLRLKPQTHKIHQGQLVVLPSKRLLVDFREGERRKGRQGKEVLVISSDGTTVGVYDAPHLSTPCCLAEPVTTYTAHNLPAQYAKLYEDAAKLVANLNSRIPKLVHYTLDAKCMLMANGPPGDVELLIPANEDTRSSEKETIRLHLQRDRRTLEVSRHIPKAGSRKDVGEWTKKVIPLDHSLEPSKADCIAMDGLERLAMTRLGDFLRICEVTDAVDITSDAGVQKDNKLETAGRERLERALRNIENKSKDMVSDARVPSSSRAGSCASGALCMGVVVPPRPRKFSATMLR